MILIQSGGGLLSSSNCKNLFEGQIFIRKPSGLGYATRHFRIDCSPYRKFYSIRIKLCELLYLTGPVGFKPTTYSLEGCYSIQLSYGPNHASRFITFPLRRYLGQETVCSLLRLARLRLALPPA